MDEAGSIVLYRCKYNSKSGEWGEVNMDDPILVTAIVRDDKNIKNIKKINATLQSLPIAPLKQTERNCKRKK